MKGTDAKMHNLENDEVAVPTDGTVVTVDLTTHKVPNSAVDVIVYVRVGTGYITTITIGDLIVQSGDFTDNLFLRTYNQGAITFNSDYFTLPISASRTITAKVVTEVALGSGAFFAELQVVGYVD